DVGVVKVPPSRVASVPPLRGRWRTGRVAVQPPLNVVMVELLAPHQARDRLPQYPGLIDRGSGRDQRGEELVRLGPAGLHHRVETRAQIGVRDIAPDQAQT